MLRDLAGIAVIVGISGFGAFLLGMPTFRATSAILLAVGCAVSLLLNFGRRRSSAAVLAGFAAGMFVKMAGLSAIYLSARRAQADPAPPLLFALLVLLLFSIWTTYRFSRGEKQ